MALKITKAEKAELVNITKNANAKRARLIKQGVPASQLPYPFKWQTKTTRKGLNEYKQALTGFTNRSNQNYQYIVANNGVAFTKAQETKLKLEQAKANRRIMQNYNRFKDSPYKIASEVTSGITPSVMRTVGSDRMSQSPPVYTKDITAFTSFRELEAYMERMRRVTSEGHFEARDNTLKDNYTTALINVFGSDANDIVWAINEMDTLDFIETYYTHDTDIPYIYGRSNYQRKLASLRGIWLGM